MLLSQRILNDRIVPKRNTAAIQLLEDLTRQMVHRISAHDWYHLDFAELLSKDYSSYLEYHSDPYARGREAYIENYRAFVAANPTYSIEPISLMADINENNNTAMVWMLLKVKGHPRDVERESVTIVYWRKRGGKWQAYKQTGMRGAGGCL